MEGQEDKREKSVHIICFGVEVENRLLGCTPTEGTEANCTIFPRATGVSNIWHLATRKSNRSIRGTIVV